jgi:hypothetical protein
VRDRHEARDALIIKAHHFWKTCRVYSFLCGLRVSVVEVFFVAFLRFESAVAHNFNQHAQAQCQGAGVDEANHRAKHHRVYKRRVSPDDLETRSGCSLKTRCRRQMKFAPQETWTEWFPASRIITVIKFKSNCSVAFGRLCRH